MAVDMTVVFRASVKTVKTRNKAMGVGYDSSRDELMRRDRPKHGFSSRAKEVISNITKLKDFLLQHRKDYVNASSLISSDLNRMTDNERDQIDQDAQIFMRTCSDAIKQLRTEAEKTGISAQMKEHRGAVLDLIESYLKSVCKLYSEQRAIRVKRVEQDTQAVYCPCSDDMCVLVFVQFEQENKRLVSEMNSLVDEVRQIEGKVVEISRLQEIFAEKVLHQETEIDNIHQLVVGATENVKEGNEDIREAIKNNAGFRVWILFFLVMCSFSLLFLDWYDS
uniref:Syntaxin-18 n=1 Tax=Pygocentrus nattereri TaxID=42514 RepID=A0AAR2LVS5_PYGNA